MTNVSAGSKRSWEGHNGEPESQSYKRQRGREDSRSWRDVHLRSPDDKRGKPSSRRDSRDRRGHRSRERDRERVERDPRRASDYARDRDRRDGREKDRERDHKRRDDDRRDGRRRTPAPPDQLSPVVSNGNVPPLPPRADSDREEGYLPGILLDLPPRPPPSNIRRNRPNQHPN
ncbi:hypothetical protein PAXRUDRAFT_507894 [Paxillus rubicundulus Ve08.2h10]|uniref:Uncharacterized protein n=1 Tax=Paxillus rubicundulus Ve08.2h10 TaxID=930991 RepID=A0A0D0DNU7_9AGAM|nr:hypothetical protein PAXRUDRAFT_507894 [Paxillus rubicundulus Ve08.2h10]